MVVASQLLTLCACLDRYLGGVLDFTGELNRYAIARATVRDVEAVRACRDLVEDIMAEFLEVYHSRQHS